MRNRQVVLQSRKSLRDKYLLNYALNKPNHDAGTIKQGWTLESFLILSGILHGPLSLSWSPIRESVVSRRESSKVPFVDTILYNLWIWSSTEYKLTPFVSLSELCLILA